MELWGLSSLLGGAPNTGRGLWAEIVGAGLAPSLLCGLERSLSFPDLGFLGCGMRLTTSALSLWEVTDVKSHQETEGLCLSNLCRETKVTWSGNVQRVTIWQLNPPSHWDPTLASRSGVVLFKEQGPAPTSHLHSPDPISLGYVGISRGGRTGPTVPISQMQKLGPQEGS